VPHPSHARVRFFSCRASARHFPPAWGFVVILSPPSAAARSRNRVAKRHAGKESRPAFLSGGRRIPPRSSWHRTCTNRNKKPESSVRTGIPNVNSVTFFECQNDNNSRWDFSLLLAKASTKTGYSRRDDGLLLASLVFGVPLTHPL
jgi:hypothetical protein